MRRFYKLLFCLCIASAMPYAITPANATDKAKPATMADNKKQLDRLFQHLLNAKDENQARQLEGMIWRTWLAHPDAEIQRMVNQAILAGRSHNFEKAIKLLGKVIERAPDYAEAYNQRAIIFYLSAKFDKSLSDIEKVLELEPRHFGAMAGQAQILMRQGRFNTAQKVLKNAVKIHPFLKERALIVDTGEKDI